MGPSTQRPAGTVAAASFGDLVTGLASTSPPLPYVGELGAATDMAAQSVVGDLLRAAGAPIRSQPKVRVGGQTLGTVAEIVRAIPASPTPGMARMLTGCAIMRVAGQAVTLQGAPAFVTPQSALADLGGGQSIVRVRGAGPEVEPPEGGDEGPSLSDARQSVPPRVSFAEPSALHRIVSACSPGRRLDLAPAIYQVLVGDPVDVVTGSVVTRATDFAQPWPAFELRRRYDSRRSGRCSPLGHGWTHGLDQALWLEPGRVVVRDGDGREHEFSTMELPGRTCRPGDALHDAARRQRLRCVAEGQWELSDGRSLRQFAALDLRSERGPGGREDPERGLARLTRLVHRDGPMIECVWSPAPAGAAGPGAVLVEVRADGNPVLRLEHDGTGLLRRLSSVSAEGELVEASYQYSADRDLVQVSDGEGRAQRYAYCGHLLVQETNRDGGRFHYGYDGVGPRARCVRAWGEGGFLDRALEHDPSGGRTTVRDGLGHETVYRYDAAGLVTEVVSPAGERVAYRYDEHLRLVETSWADGTRATAAYDDMGNLVRRSERDGATWTMEHDARGRLVQGTDPQGGCWRFLHDERGRLRQLQDPAGHVTVVDFERGGCRVLDATGHAVQLGLDGHDRIIEMPSGGGERLRFAYDHRGRLATAWGAKNLQLHWRYDRANRLVRFERAGKRTAWRRNGEGEVTAIEHDGRTTRIERDAFGTIHTIDDGERAVAYVHDREGRLTAARAGEELLALEHGPDGHVRRFTARGLPQGELHREAKDGRVTALRLGDEHIALQHDAAGRITKIDHGHGRERTFAYRPDGHLVAATNEHVACTFERDPRGAVTEQRWGSVVMSEASPDHRGRRGGLRLAKRGRLSYLRAREGTVERIAVVAEPGPGARAWVEPHELPPAPSPDQATIPVPAFEAASVDALGRSVSSRGPDHVVWDEDRCVAVGDMLVIHHPDAGHPLYAIDGEGRVRPLAPPDPRDVDPLDGLLGAAFPRAMPPSAAPPSPTALLAGLLGHHAWTPQVRPVPGSGPWDPDRWGPRVDAPEADSGRLDAKTLLRALGSPFPRPELAIRSFDRRLPPPEPVP